MVENLHIYEKVDTVLIEGYTFNEFNLSIFNIYALTKAKLVYADKETVICWSINK